MRRRTGCSDQNVPSITRVAGRRNLWTKNPIGRPERCDVSMANRKLAVSQVRPRLINGRSHCSAILPAFASLLLQSETTWLMLLRYLRNCVGL